MGKQIIKQPNGKYCIFSTNIDNVTDYNLSPEEIIDLFLESQKKDITEKVMSIVSKLDKGEKAYHTFTIPYDEMLECIQRVHGKKEMKDVQKLINS